VSPARSSGNSPFGVRMTTTFTADRAEAVAASLQKRLPELGDR
jgi:hypothetical protein